MIAPLCVNGQLLENVFEGIDNPLETFYRALEAIGNPLVNLM
jgi:hypothetical protein